MDEGRWEGLLPAMQREEAVSNPSEFQRPACTEACRTPVRCATCRRMKAPRGRSVPVGKAGRTVLCTFECPGYYDNPQPPHLWPTEDLG